MVRVFLDGRPVLFGEQGKDVRNGEVEVVDDRLYHLLSLKTAGDHTLTLEFQGSPELFAFTFG